MKKGKFKKMSSFFREKMSSCRGKSQEPRKESDDEPKQTLEMVL